MPTIRFICLANSTKLQGRCVAGWKVNNSGWIRPVSTLGGGTLNTEYLYQNGTEAKLLDIVEATLTTPKPQSHQPENWVLGPPKWRLIGHITSAQAPATLTPALSRGPAIFGCTSDRVPYAPLQTAPAASSLALIEPTDIEWVISNNWSGKRKLRCIFLLNGAHYNLSVTDPVFSKKMLATMGDGNHPRDVLHIKNQHRVFLTISLGEPLDVSNLGVLYCFKLIAAVVAV